MEDSCVIKVEQKKGTTLLKETEKYFEKFMIYVTIYMY